MTNDSNPGDPDSIGDDIPPDRLVRRKAGEIPPATPEHLDELRAAMDGPIDCTDIPERTEPGRRVVRDADGRIAKKDGP